MTGYVLKPALGRVTVETDWSRGYLAPGERVAAILGWAIHGRGDAAPGLRVVAARLDAGRSRLTVEGGVPGWVFMLIVRVATDAGRALERAVVVRIAIEPRPD